MKKDFSLSEGCLALIILLVLLYLGVFINAWLLTSLWDWFIVPQFNLASLSYVNAAGLSIIITQLTKQDLSSLMKKPDESSMWTKVFEAVLKTLLQPLVVFTLAKFILWLL